jgi:toxin-antitoxin system PIN domain toxin
MPALCDINFLFVLATDQHEHHARAAAWLEQAGPGDAIVCRQAQLGFFRLLNNPAVLQEEALRSDACWRVWQQLIRDERFRFMSEEPEGVDELLKRFTDRREFTPKLWTDAYLAAFAKAAGFSIVTFDAAFRQFQGIQVEVL